MGKEAWVTSNIPYIYCNLTQAETSMVKNNMQAFGNRNCHAERSEASGCHSCQMLRCAQHDSQGTSQVHSWGSLLSNCLNNMVKAALR